MFKGSYYLICPKVIQYRKLDETKHRFIILNTSDIKSEPSMLRYHKALPRNEKIQDTVEACSLIPLNIHILTISLFIIVGKTLKVFMNLQSLYI